jgi:hypothetical protein
MLSSFLDNKRSYCGNHLIGEKPDQIKRDTLLLSEETKAASVQPEPTRTLALEKDSINKSDTTELGDRERKVKGEKECMDGQNEYYVSYKVCNNDIVNS